MQIRGRFQKAICHGLLMVALAGVASVGMENSAQAHHPFLRHRLHSHLHFHHFGYRPYYYSSFYSYSPYYYSSYYYPTYYASYYPAYSCWYPRYYSVNYYAPIVVPYNTFYYGPTIDPFFSWSGTSSTPSTYLATTSPAAKARAAIVNRTASMTETDPITNRGFLASAAAPGTESNWTQRDPATLVERIDDVENRLARGGQPQQVESDSRIHIVNKPAILHPYSPIWTKAAVGLVDDMVAAGDFSGAQMSCKSMDRIEQPKGAGVYLRQALMIHLDPENQHKNRATEDVLHLLELACAAGSQLDGSELPQSSISEYLAPCQVSVQEALDSLSKSVLEAPDSSRNELVLLAALLKLDGQKERAALFANEIATRPGARWHFVVEACKLP